MIKETKNEAIEVEYGVDSRYSSKKEKELDGKMLMEARLQRMNNVSKNQIIQAKLLQLKLKMEGYIEQPVYQDAKVFTSFLTTYIDTIYPKRILFAKDINITPVRLSQVLNNHRAPSDEFILRLTIHAKKIYNSICQFQKQIWYQVYYQEKICNMMFNQGDWESNIEKHVTISTPVVV